MKLTPRYPVNTAELALAVAGMMVAGLLLFVSADLLAGGALTGAITGLGSKLTDAGTAVLRSVGNGKDDEDSAA